MNEDFQRAKLQGTLGALCLLVASIAYSIKGEITYLDSQILVWIFAFTFLYHALKNIQNITGPQVFIIFKYAYSIALAALLYFSAIYILRRCDYNRLQIYVPYLIFAVTLAWIIINLNAILPSGILQDKLEISFEKSVLVKTSDDCSLVMISKAIAFSSLSIWEQGEILGIKDHKKLQKNISLLQFLQSKKSVGEIIKFTHLKKRLAKRRLDDLCNLSLIKRTDAFYEALIS